MTTSTGQVTATTSARSEPGKARENLTGLLITGGMLLIVGGFLAAVGYLHTSPDSLGARSNGSVALVIVGAFIVAVAQCFLLVGLIGFGVKLGIAAARPAPTDDV